MGKTRRRYMVSKASNLGRVNLVMNNLNKRLIARLDIKKNRLIKGVHFEGLRHIGDPKDYAIKYYDQGIDEILLLDTVASLHGRNALYNIIDEITNNIFIPITIGGGINSLEQAKKMFDSGADKITINTFAIENPSLINKIASNFGSQAITISLQVKRINNSLKLMKYNGREISEKKIDYWIKEIEERGAGEIMVTSIDKDGTLEGFDMDLLNQIKNLTNLPIICSGGISSSQNIQDCFNNGSQAVAIASAFHYEKLSLVQVKSELIKKSIKIRSY
ncbi:imidazole glycerol phosphate synthase cyclase subunit [Prochlorococcus sp. AH-736-A21]|nr:imidazole glycerol phosphate synthase cyclase subunit [Prochlorococcus sp. AH-736-A21]